MLHPTKEQHTNMDDELMTGPFFSDGTKLDLEGRTVSSTPDNIPLFTSVTVISTVTLNASRRFVSIS